MKEWLRTYRNFRDADIETFLHNSAIEYERRKKCATYLLIPENTEVLFGTLIEGYFTLSIRPFAIPDNVSRNLRHKLNGGFSNDASVGMILIGQLGKYCESESVQSSVHLSDILDTALDLIRESDQIIPCRHVLLECRKERDGLRHKYESYGFQLIQEDETYAQYALKI